MKRTLTIILMLVMALPAFAQDQKPAELTALQQHDKEDIHKQMNEALAKRTADEHAQKAKADAAAQLDNKNPQPIKKAEDREKLSTMFVSVLMAQQEFFAKQQQANAFLAAPKQQLEAASKALQDAVKEYQKTHHAEGCIVTLPKLPAPDKPEDRGLTWDCTNAAENVARQ
jgi:hypothetical protein